MPFVATSDALPVKSVEIGPTCQRFATAAPSHPLLGQHRTSESFAQHEPHRCLLTREVENIGL